MIQEETLERVRAVWASIFLRAIVFCVLLFFFEGVEAQSRQLVEIEMWLEAGIPDQVVLSRNGGAGYEFKLDSVWMDSDGWYHLRVNDFCPGLYTVRLGGGGCFPLLLSRARHKVRVWVHGQSPVASIRVEGAPEALAYARAIAAQEQYEEWRRVVLRFAENSRSDTIPIQKLREAFSEAEMNFQGVLQECLTAGADSVLSHFLGVMKPVKKMDLGAESWFPGGALRDSLLVCSRALRSRVTNFF